MTATGRPRAFVDPDVAHVGKPPLRGPYSPTEADGNHRRAMVKGSLDLLRRLQDRHPAIVYRLQLNAKRYRPNEEENDQ